MDVTKPAYKILPFSRTFVMENKLHIVPRDLLGGSTILHLLDGSVDCILPDQMAICVIGSRPVGIGLVFQLKPEAHFFFNDRDDVRNEKHGFVNVYVKEIFRCRGIGARILDMAVRNFQNSHPDVSGIFVSSILKSKFLDYEGLEPIFAQTNRKSRSSFASRIRILAAYHASEQAEVRKYLSSKWRRCS